MSFLSYLKTNLSSYFYNPFKLDIRALGLFRIFIGLVVILDLIIRLGDLQAHYSNQGVLPIPALILNNWVDQFFSLFMITGNIWLLLVLFLFSLLIAVLFTIGYHTRLNTILLWILVLSVQSRNPYIHQGGDDLLRLMLFWGIFLPLGSCFSVDAKKNNYKIDHFPYFHFANIGLILLIFSVYFFSANLKTGAEWRTEGTALYYALSLDQIQLPLGRVLLEFPTFIKWISLSVFYLELLAPFFLLFPIFTNYFRYAFIILMVFLHIGIGFTLYVGLFFIINLVSLIALLPTPFLDKFQKYWLDVDEWFRKLFETIVELKQKLNLNTDLILPKLNTESWIVSSLCFFFILYCFFWNLGGITRIGLTKEVKMLGFYLRLDQSWGMFSPTVFKDDGWYILEAVQENDLKTIDLKTEKPVNYDKPQYVLGGIKNDRWRKYFEAYLFVSNANIRGYFCHYTLNKWNQEHPENLVEKLDVIYMKEVTPPPGQIGSVTREVLCTCVPNPPSD